MMQSLCCLWSPSSNNEKFTIKVHAWFNSKVNEVARVQTSRSYYVFTSLRKECTGVQCEVHGSPIGITIDQYCAHYKNCSTSVHSVIATVPWDCSKPWINVVNIVV